MLYYYNRDGKFQKESGKEYKTEKGAVEKLQKEGEGAVFDETGQMVFSLADKGEAVSDAEASEGAAESQGQLDGEPDEERHGPEEPERAEKPGRAFDVQTTCDSLRIRAGAGKDYRIAGYIREKAGNKKNHSIVKEKDGWGKLAGGEGWIELAFTKKAN